MKEKPGFFRTRFGLVFGVFVVVAGLLLISEHRAHINLGGAWPLLLLIGLCIGMHLFMHHGMSDRDHSDREH